MAARAAPGAAAPLSRENDVHALAAEVSSKLSRLDARRLPSLLLNLLADASACAQAAEFEANVEKFLDEALITDFQNTPLHTLERAIRVP